MSTTRRIPAVLALVSAAVALGPAPAAAGEGSELPDGSVVIPSLPFADTGDTSDNVDDRNAECPFANGGGKDVFYAFTPASDMSITIDLCNSEYDTKTYVLDEELSVVACNDDACEDEFGDPTLRSLLECVPLTAGVRYHIAVDGFDGTEQSYGVYELLVAECEPPPPFECPEEAIDEGEPCVDGAPDDFNGGCNFEPERFSPIACGDVICGEGWSLGQGGPRDTDWYEIVVDRATGFTLRGSFSFETGFLGFIAMVPGSEGSGECDDVLGAFPFTFGDPGEVVTITTDVMPPGTHWLFVAPVVDSLVTCAGSNDYWIELVCDRCTGDINGDGTVDFTDILLILSLWGPCESGCLGADLDGDGMVGFSDLLIVLREWGPCF